ncbi:MAG: hypothetical protein ACYTGB_10280 [Planctomycetota bacterium]
MSIWLTVVCFGAALAGEAPRKGALAGLPSQPGPHVAKIRAMGDRSWLDLGAPKPDPKWGMAPGRSYTNKLTYAPDLVGGFLFGEGVHGARGTGPRAGYYNDDVFFYDLMGHRYVCVYPGTKEGTVKFKVDEKGFCAAPDGQNFPVAIAVHGYECQSYNPDTGEFMTLLTGSPYSRKISAMLPVKGKGSMRDRKKSSKHPYFYTRDGRWDRRKVEGAGPSAHFCKTLRYIPSKKQTLYFSRRGAKTLWFYDHAGNKWNKVTPQGTPPEAKGIEGSTAYDSKRDRLYMFNSGAEVVPGVYDFKTNTYSTPKTENQPYPPSNGYEKGQRVLSSTSSGAHYDPGADVVVMRLKIKQGTGDPRNIRGKTLGLAVYGPEKNAWEKEFVPLPEAAKRKAGWNSCYSPELNVHVYHLAGDSRANGTVVVYRHKRRAP